MDKVKVHLVTSSSLGWSDFKGRQLNLLKTVKFMVSSRLPCLCKCIYIILASGYCVIERNAFVAY